MDWKKDMKLSDLLARGRGDGEEANALHEEPYAPEEPVHQGGSDPEFESSEDEPEKRSFFTRSLSFGRTKDAPMSDDDLDSTAVEPEETAPFWKRELSFGRRKDDQAPETFEHDDSPQAEEHLELDEPHKEPFWKRELSFGRRKDDQAPETFEQDDSPQAEEQSEPDELPKTPFWKRELSFGRRKDDATSEIAFEREEEPEPAPDVFETDQPEKTPFWKREFGFGKRKGEATPETFERDASETDAAADDVFESDAVERKPFWKRELRFGRGKEAADWEADADTPAAEAEERTPFWKRELRFGRGREEETTETPVEHEEPEFVEPEAVAAAVPEPADEMHWTEKPSEDDGDATSETTVEYDEPAPFEPEPVAAVPEPEPVHQAHWTEEISDHDAADETAPEPAAEHQEPASVEPQPVAEAYDAPEPVELTPSTEEPSFAGAVDEPHEEEAPFWKREIKFGRRRGDADQAPHVGFPLPPSAEADTFTEAGPDSETEGRRFWKRELKLGRGQEKASEMDFDAPSEREKKSFFTLSLRREKDPDSDAPKPEKRPFFKRELSFRREKDTGRGHSAGRAALGGRTKQLVGLKVGASQIAAARIVNNGSPELVQLARQSIEQGIVVGGELRDPDALAEALREFFAKHKLPNRNVRLGIGNNRIGVRSFEISGVHDPKQLENAIRFRAQEALPIPLDEAVLDYQVIDESASPTGIRTYRVLLVVAYRELIDRYVAACRVAGLRLVGIDLEAFALLRALSPPAAEGLPEDTALVAVSIGHDRSTFAVSNGTVCEFTRVLDWGGSSLNTAIARALDITPSQAEPVKRTLSLSEGEEGAPATEANEHTIRAQEAVRLELQTFARELVSSLHFYQNQPGSLAIGSITLTGGTAHLPGLAAELQRLIGVKVRVGDPLRRLKTAKRVETPAQVGSMAVAIGLGIED